MTDYAEDYDVFGAPGEAGGALDGDLALISAYLAGELSPVQVAAVKRRLETDAEFRTAVEPILALWDMPVAAMRGPLFVTRAELDTGWRRITGAPPAPARTATVAGRWLRAAGIALAIGAPGLGLAQAIDWMAERPGATFRDAVHALFGLEMTTLVTSRSGTLPLPAPAPASHPLGLDSSPGRATELQLSTAAGATQPDLPVPGPAPAQTVPIRPLGPVVAQATIPFGRVASIHHLSDGRVLVNDPVTRRVVLLDANLSNPTVVIDSAPGRPNSYGRSATAIIPYLGDSTLFVDPTTRVFLVIDPAGRIARVTPMPGALTSPGIGPLVPTMGYPATSATLGVVMRMNLQPDLRGVRPGDMFVTNDSMEVVALDLARRRVDTLMRLPTGQGVTMRVTGGRGGAEIVTSPGKALLVSTIFPVHDDWAVTTDGSVAILRGQEYRLDWINPDRTTTVSPRIPYDWKRNSDDDKVRIADSVTRGVQASYDYSLHAWQRDSAAGTAGQRPEHYGTITAANVPDYLPALASLNASIRADDDNNVWIHTRRYDRPPTFPLFDVVNRQGVLIDRVQLPTGKTIAGFGAGGWIYLITRDAGKDVLERARIR